MHLAQQKEVWLSVDCGGKVVVQVEGIGKAVAVQSRNALFCGEVLHIKLCSASFHN
jgi:hypothetical protein